LFERAGNGARLDGGIRDVVMAPTLAPAMTRPVEGDDARHLRQRFHEASRHVAEIAARAMPQADGRAPRPRGALLDIMETEPLEFAVEFDETAERRPDLLRPARRAPRVEREPGGKESDDGENDGHGSDAPAFDVEFERRDARLAVPEPGI